MNDRIRNEVVAVQTAGFTQNILGDTNVQILIYNRIIRDNLSQYNATTNTFTAASDGNYLVTIGLHMSDLTSGGVNYSGVRQLYLYKNNAFFVVMSRAIALNTISSETYLLNSSVVRLNAGETLTFYVYHSAGGITLPTLDDTKTNNLTITKLNS